MSSRRLSTTVALASLALVLTLSACAGRPEPATPTPQVVPSATSLFPSRTPTITATSTATPPTIPPSPTPTATGMFMQASVYAVGRLSGDRLLVSITVPAAKTNPNLLNQDFTAVVDPSTLDCQVLPQYPDRLYCIGPDFFVNYQPLAAELSLYSADQGSPVLVTEFTIPALPTLTPTPSETPKPSATP
jgi:hypothetical protein